MELASLIAIFVGMAGFAVVLLPGQSPQLYAMSPQEFTAWVSAIVGAVTSVANLVFYVYHRIGARPRPKRPRKPKYSTDDPSSA